MSGGNGTKLVHQIIPATLPTPDGNRVQFTFYGIGYAETNHAVAFTGLFGGGRDAESQADARRLAACWNLCIGTPTVDLEETSAPLIYSLSDGIRTKTRLKRAEALLAEVLAQDDDAISKLCRLSIIPEQKVKALNEKINSFLTKEGKNDQPI